ncbi:MAG: phospholipase D-like domain-containing protein, partial [Anaerolineae bacterium]|nr:phospholipase D-like domain-containing protein [Anaerolineae bacterium]
MHRIKLSQKIIIAGGLVCLLTAAVLVYLFFNPVTQTELISDVSSGKTAYLYDTNAAEKALPAWLKIYFTSPPEKMGKGVNQVVLPYINGAKNSIDVTSFDLNLPEAVNALAAASRRGIKVRVVYDGENGNLELQNESTQNQKFETIKVLKSAGVGLVNGGRSNGLMHDKFMIIDGKTLFVGSWNLSYNDTYRNNNNLLRITNTQIIKNYQAKFNELFIDQRFGVNGELKVPQALIKIGDTRVENYFSPNDRVMDKIIEAVISARQSVHFLIFTYTDENLARAMIGRAKAGVDVAGVIES